MLYGEPPRTWSLTERRAPADVDLPEGYDAYRSFVGPPQNYDLVGAMQFCLLASLGLREHHTVLDVGCGSLRAGRLLIPYLLPDRYFGIEPERWLIDEGIARELGRDVVRVKRPTFSDVDDFRLTVFGRRFDFVVAQSIFSHAPPHQIRRCLDEGARSLAAGGVFAATFIEGSQDHAGSDWVYPGNVTYTWSAMRSFAEAAGLAARPIDWPHPHGQRWLLLTRREEHALGPDPAFLVASRPEDHVKTYQERLARITGNPLVRAYLRASRAVRRPRARH